MTLIGFEGFTGVLPASLGGSASTTIPTGTLSAGSSGGLGMKTGRDGSANGAVGNTSSAIGNIAHAVPFTGSDIITGAAILCGGSVKLLACYAIAGGGTPVFSIEIDGTGTMSLKKSGTTISGAPTAPIPLGTWIYVEAKVHLSGSSGTVEVRINGNTVLTYTGQIVNASTGYDTMSSFAWGAGTGGGYAASLDDIYWCDTTDGTAAQGAANDDFLGDVKVVALLPASAGSSTDWTPSSGANYACVDENPVNTTDYITSDADGEADSYTLGVLDDDVTGVYGVKVRTYGKKSDAGNGAVAASVTPVGGTAETDLGVGLSVSWGLVDSAPWWLNPSTDAAWEPSEVSGMQAGVTSDLT